MLLHVYQWYVYLWLRLFFNSCSSSLACSYSVTSRNYQFCHSCKYYNFETVQHCSGTTTNPKTSPSGEALWELMENHTMPWHFLLFLKASYVYKTSFNSSLVATVSTKQYLFGFCVLGTLCFSALDCSRTSCHGCRPTQLSAVENALYFCINPGKIKLPVQITSKYNVPYYIATT